MANGLYFHKTAEMIEVTIRDGTNAKIETRRCRISDVKEIDKIMKWLKDKYNYEPTIVFSSQERVTDKDKGFLDF